jgi:hypothetical protein
MKPFFGRVVLNDTTAPPAAGSAAAAESLQRAVLGAIAAHTRADGRLDYAKLRASSDWSEAVARAGALQGLSLGDLNGRQPRLAFWINVYHALVFHAIVALGIRRTVWEMRGFYGRVLSNRRLRAERGRRRARHPARQRSPRVAPAPAVRRARPAPDPGGVPGGPAHPLRHHLRRPVLPAGGRLSGEAALDQQLDLAARNFLNQAVAVDGQGCVTCSRTSGGTRGTSRRRAGWRLPGARLDAGPAREAVAGRARPCDAYRPYDWALQHEPAE